MKGIKLIVCLIGVSILGCKPANTSYCEYDIVYTEDCPCKENMYRWYDMCRYKNHDDLVFRGGGSLHDCMDDFLVIIPIKDKVDQFILLQKNGLLTVTHVIRRTDEWIYSEVLSQCVDGSRYPIFQVGINLKEALAESPKIRGEVNWWHDENQTYADTTETFVYEIYGR